MGDDEQDWGIIKTISHENSRELTKGLRDYYVYLHVRTAENFS